ncbi:MAG: hypothetical protein A2959_03555 [Candidatus Levybacteria bacterium RIFCSPLOWO2_01_FULL_38_23]|nr:MAG: hypothetical protein A2959_03555 [Candidatus Levybacteria bacterium RIFCSPLOWO2_01_FULL_38_23]
MQQNSTYEQNQNQRTVDLHKIIKRAVFSYWPVVILALISSILAILNYTPGTWLSGWDSLHPEFNFGLNIERLVNGVFRTEQGLGAVAAHSHMADLPRVLFLYLEHFVIPQSMLRYSWVFLNLIAGPVGMYLFLNKFILKNKLASFLGALFYLLNLGTVQIFNVPFEMFTTLYATLPFVFYFACRYLIETKNKERNLLLFSIAVIFTAPAAYAATLWYAFFVTFSLYILTNWLFNGGAMSEEVERGGERGGLPTSARSELDERGHRTGVKRDRTPLKKALVLILLTIALNLFWIAPNLYFLLTHADEVQNANINLLFSQSAFLKNKEFGDLGSLFFLKTFYFDWSIYNGKEFVSLLGPYIEHLKDIKMLALGFLAGLSFLFGILSYIWNKKRASLPFLLPFLLTLFFMINYNFPTGPLFDFLQTHFPFFKEAFRFPQNKFLNEYVFFTSIFFGYFTLLIINKLKSRNRQLFIAAIVALSLAIYSLASFQGNLINKFVKVQIPTSYFALFNHLESEPSTVKVANFPIQSPWGWVYYKWGFQGAGFLYFGIKQPLLDRDFDRWSPYNESYYREASYAVYKKDAKLLGNVFKKYNVGYVFIDRSVFEPNKPVSVLFFESSEKLIKETGLVLDTKTFGDIKLFKLSANESLFSTIQNPKNISPSTKSIYTDFAYENIGNYITNQDNSIYYPFRNLVDNQGRLISKNVVFEPDRINFKIRDKASVNSSEFLESQNTQRADLIMEKTSSALNLSIYPTRPVLDTTTLSIPLKASLNPVGQFLSINQGQLFNLENYAQNTPVVLGNILLEQTNQISLYNPDSFQTLEKVGEIINPFFESCNGQTPPNAEIFGGKVTLSGKGSICVLVPYGFFPNDSQELLTNFGFDFKTTSKLTSCIFDQSTSSCKFFKDPTVEKSQNANIASFLYTIPQQAAGHFAIKLFFEKPQTEESKVELSNFFASFTKPSESTLLEQEKPQAQNLDFKNIYIPNTSITSTDSIFEKTFENDCKGNATVSKKEILKQGDLQMLKYSSVVGSFCDHFSFPNLTHNLGYFVTVKSKNESGLPMTLCITNYTSRKCDIYTTLSGGGGFKDDIFVLPPTDSDAVGYDVNFENTAVSKTSATNYVSSVEFIPFPYEAISKITLGNSSNPENVLSFNYSFEEGFRAYEINDDSVLNTLLPFIFGKQLRDHVLVNNWTNGWKMEDIKHQIVVVFLPQYLEYLGLGLIIFTLSYLIIKIRKH